MTNQKHQSTVLDLLDVGESDHPAIVVPDGPAVTYGELRDQVRSLMADLRALGIERGDRVAMVVPNGIEAIVCFLAASGAATAAPLNPAYTGDEFKFYIEDTGARALITSDQAGEEARRVTSGSVTQITATLTPDGRVNLAPSGEGDRDSEQGPAPDDVALVLHTSGTTSRPKRVPLPHGNLAVSARNIVDTYRLTPDDVSLCVMPLFHVHGLVASTLSTFLSGGTIVAPPRFNALNLWQVAQAHNVTWFSAVPSMHQALLQRAKRAGGSPGPGYEGLRFIRSCSSPLPASAMLELEERFDVPVLEAYGMTEAAHQMSSNPLPPGKRTPGAVGPGTGVRIGIMDEDGGLQPAGTRGEVVIQGANVIDGYEDNPEANATSFTDGWFRTGDEGHLDADGVLTLVGRLKELINRAGEKISPVEIDEALLSHPAVSEAVAFAIPDPRYGEQPAAAVVLSAEVTERELTDHCRTSLADFKCPRVIHIVDAIPRTATGKVQRRIVAESFAGE